MRAATGPISMRRVIAAAALATMTGLSGALAAEEGPAPRQQSWTFAGLFGTYDENQLQRGFQIFREVCASCHSADLLAFRNLAEPGGPNFTEDQIKLLASQYNVPDEEDPLSERPAVPADHWPNPWPSPADARAANNGVVPPDFSVIAKARSIHMEFPWWIVNYFTAYQEGGADYIYNLLTGYHDEPPEDFVLGEGQYYNDHFPGHALSMAPPLGDGYVDYEGVAVPETVDQYATDVAAFLMWVAEPHLAERKAIGFRVLIFLALFAALMYLTYKKIWSGVQH